MKIIPKWLKPKPKIKRTGPEPVRYTPELSKRWRNGKPVK